MTLTEKMVTIGSTMVGMINYIGNFSGLAWFTRTSEACVTAFLCAFGGMAAKEMFTYIKRKLPEWKQKIKIFFK